MCEFNMAVTVREERSRNVDLTNAKYWLTGDIGDEWGTEQKGTWVVVSFDPKTTKKQRDALAPIILKTYGLECPELKVQGSAHRSAASGGRLRAHGTEGRARRNRAPREEA